MKVSVLMITYNHEKFIRNALESILMQKVNFDYEIVIGEDGSTDNTKNIVVGYQKQYPDKINALFTGKNLGMLRNYARTFKFCMGDYIAVLDGDDYWTSPDKLQEQIDYMDRNSDCSFCFHKVRAKYENGHDAYDIGPLETKEKYTLEDLVLRNFIANSSVVYRRGIIDDFPDWWYSVGMTDWTTHILHAQHGKAGYIDKTLGIYRIHGDGVWSLRSEESHIIENIKAYESINAHLNYQFDDVIRNAISVYCYKLTLLFYENGDFANAKHYANKCFRVYPLNREISRSIQLKILLKSNLSWMFSLGKSFIYRDHR